MSSCKTRTQSQADLINGVTDAVVRQPIDREALTTTNNISTEILCDNSEPNPVLSRKRWHILIAVCLFGMSISVQTTGPILDLLLELIGVKVDTYLYIDLIFNYLIALFALPSAVFLDKFGLRPALHVASCLFVISSLFASLLYFTELPGWQHYRMFFYIMTHLFKTGCFAMLFLFPLKVSESWFSASERSLAWMIMWHQLEIGNCIACLVYPRIIYKPTDLRILAYIGIVTSALSMISCIALVTKSEPPTPPSKRATIKKQAPLFASFKRIITRQDILLHSIHGSIFASVNLTFGIVLQNIFSSMGLSQVFAGNYMLINSMITIILSIIMSIFVHKVANVVRSCKVGSILQTIQFIVLLLAVMQSAPGTVLIAISLGLHTFRSWTIPHFNEMTAHLVSGVVSNPTIMGFSLVVTPILMSLTQTIFASLIVKKDKTNDYHNALIFLIGVSVANEMIYQVFFRGKTSGGESSPDNQAVAQEFEPTDP